MARYKFYIVFYILQCGIKKPNRYRRPNGIVGRCDHVTPVTFPATAQLYLGLLRFEIEFVAF